MAAIGWLMLSATAPLKQNNAPQPHVAEERSGKTPERPAGLPKQQPTPRADDRGCQGGKEDRSSELCAQWKAADAALSSAAAAWILGGVGALIGAITMFAAIRAGVYAKDAAKHTETGSGEAKRAADAAEQTLRSTRAWMTFDAPISGTVTDDSNAEPKVIGFHITLGIKNTGQSPAVRCGIMTKFEIGDFGSDPPAMAADKFPAPLAAVGPGQVVYSTPFFLKAEEFDAFIKRKISIFVYCLVSYEDIFGVARETEICVAASFMAVTPENIGELHSIAISPRGPQNHAT